MLFPSCSTLSDRPGAGTQSLQIPNGWYLPKYAPPILYVTAKEEKSGYRLLIDRSNPAEDMPYLYIAESIFPSRKKFEQKLASRLDLKNWYFERLWWNEIYQDFRIPFSITSEAVKYYIEQYARIKKKIKSERKISKWKGDNRQRVFLEYTGKVKRENETDRKAIVILTLKWYLFCGQQCGWGFEKERVLRFDSDRQIRTVVGDEATTKWVSSPETPYAPNQWITF